MTRLSLVRIFLGQFGDTVVGVEFWQRSQQQRLGNISLCFFVYLTIWLWMVRIADLAEWCLVLTDYKILGDCCLRVIELDSF